MSVVGEAVQAITITWSVWSWCKESNGRIYDAYRVVSKTKARLEILKPTVEKLLDRKKQPEAYGFLEETMRSLKEDVATLAKLIEKYKNGLVGDKIWFLGKHLSKVDILVKKLEDYTKDIKDIKDDLTLQHQSDESRSKAEKKAKVDKETSRARLQQSHYEMTLREKEQLLIWRLMEKTGQKALESAARSNDNKEWEGIELALMAMAENISRVDARRILRPLREAIRDMPRDEKPVSDKSTGTSPLPTGGNGQNPTNANLKLPTLDHKPSPSAGSGGGKKTPVPKKPPTPAPAPSASPSVSPSPSPSSRARSPAGSQASTTSKMKHVSRIACIDFENSARSVMAQLFFEHRRIWTVNTSGHWLFDSVESAGVGIKTDFAVAAVAAAKTTITLGKPTGNTVASAATFDCFYTSFNNQISHDTKPVYERVQTAKRQGVKMRTFMDFHHIICFGAYTRGVLADMEKYAQTQIPPGGRPLKAQITVLEVAPPSENASDEVLKRTLDTVREKVDAFLVTMFNWTKPQTTLWDGAHRTRQFLLVGSKKEVVRAKIAEIKKEGKCKLVKDNSVPGGRLVTLVAPRDFTELEKVEEDIKAACI